MLVCRVCPDRLIVTIGCTCQMSRSKSKVYLRIATPRINLKAMSSFLRNPDWLSSRVVLLPIRFACMIYLCTWITMDNIASAQNCESCTKDRRGKVDWTAMPSRYTHDESGQAVDQFAVPADPIAVSGESLQRSGYRHYRSTLQAGGSADNLHVVEEWGAPVRPYEEWRFPYRPYSSPYPNWAPQPPIVGVYPPFFGNPYAGPYGPAVPNGGMGGVFPQNGNGPMGANGQIGVPPPVGWGQGSGFGQTPWQAPFPSNPWNQPNWGGQGAMGQPPWIDGYWPNHTEERGMSDRQFFNIPRPQ